MKNASKLSIKKVTLRNLDETELEAIAGGCCFTISYPNTCLCKTSPQVCGPISSPKKA